DRQSLDEALRRDRQARSRAGRAHARQPPARGAPRLCHRRHHGMDPVANEARDPRASWRPGSGRPRERCPRPLRRSPRCGPGDARGGGASRKERPPRNRRDAHQIHGDTPGRLPPASAPRRAHRRDPRRNRQRFTQPKGRSMSLRLRRSELSTPASSWKMIEKAAKSTADLVFLDLEDAVAPAEKEAARANVVRALRELDWGRKLRAVRVNGADTRWAHDDVLTVVGGAGERLEILILPKVKAPRDVWFFETLLDQLEAKLGLPRRIGLEALIEEAAALARVEDIAASSPRLEALILGFGDLSASQGVRLALASEYPGDLWHHARARMIVAARAHGLDAIDGPFANFRDPDGYRP